MKQPDINDKKYCYFHKKLMKRMFNNQKYLADCKKYSEFLQAQENKKENNHN